MVWTFEQIDYMNIICIKAEYNEDYIYPIALKQSTEIFEMAQKFGGYPSINPPQPTRFTSKNTLFFSLIFRCESDISRFQEYLKKNF